MLNWIAHSHPPIHAETLWARPSRALRCSMSCSRTLQHSGGVGDQPATTPETQLPNSVCWKDEKSWNLVLSVWHCTVQDGVLNLVNTLWALVNCMCSSVPFKALAGSLNDWKISDQKLCGTTPTPSFPLFKLFWSVTERLWWGNVLVKHTKPFRLVLLFWIPHQWRLLSLKEMHLHKQNTLTSFGRSYDHCICDLIYSTLMFLIRLKPCLSISTVGVMAKHMEVEEEVDDVEENLRKHIEQEKQMWV